MTSKGIVLLIGIIGCLYTASGQNKEELFSIMGLEMLELARVDNTVNSKIEISSVSGKEMVNTSDTWSDITSIFRPSRWRDPFRVGGPFSFLNLECWFLSPLRTLKTFIGTAVVIGGIGLLISHFVRDDSTSDKDSSSYLDGKHNFGSSTETGSFSKDGSSSSSDSYGEEGGYVEEER